MATCAACGYGAADSFKFCPECGAPAAGGGREQRKVVTVLFCDVVGSTSLGDAMDAEALRALLARFYERMRSIVERHGGVVEKFIGDAVMAVFGVPAAHEDDALRAVRAAAEMRAAFPELGIEGRIGVSSGEVVTGTEERLATGDAVNVAARFQQAAAPGEILLGEATLQLVSRSADAEPVEPLDLKGKTERVPAWRLVAVSADAPERRLDRPMIGRERELAALLETWEQARDGPGCRLVTIVGSAGVGKSRLAAELLTSVDAVMVRARCLSYGEGITYWPVAAVVEQLQERRAGLELDPAADQGLDVLLGRGGTSSTDELAWAFRKLLEAVAAEGPLVAVFDDIHWGEEVFLDLLEHIAFLSTGAPILLLCMARPELLERRSDWPGVVRLEPLAPEQAGALMDARLGARLDDDLRERILRSAGGNPLFVEEMAAIVQASGDGHVDVPPTIQALLASRLDQLEAPERSVLERGAVEGELFHHGAVSALSPGESQLSNRLTALVRKEFVRPDTPQLAGTDAFRFRHLLIRDAAYHGMAKAERADLHERFAGWLDEHGGEFPERDELVGYHLEQAVGYLRELGRADERGLAARAGQRLAAAGSRAVLRNDFRAGRSLLERASNLLPTDRRTPRFEVDLGWARFSTGAGEEALVGLGTAAEREARAGRRTTELALLLERGNYEILLGSDGAARRQRRLADETLPIALAEGDEWASTLAYAALAIVGEVEGRPATELAEACEHVVAHGRAADDPLWVAWGEGMIAAHQFLGATPVEECLRWLDEHPHIDHSSVAHRTRLVAMLGRFDEAHALLAADAERAAERGGSRSQMGLAWRAADVAKLEGSWSEAEVAARTACDSAEATAELVNYMLFSSLRAQALVELGRPEEATACLDRAEEIAPTDEPDPWVMSRVVRARILAGTGDFDEAERLARDAALRAGQTDRLNLHGEALLELANVLAVVGKDPRPALEQALALFERKGNLVMAERARARLG